MVAASTYDKDRCSGVHSLQITLILLGLQRLGTCGWNVCIFQWMWSMKSYTSDESKCERRGAHGNVVLHSFTPPNFWPKRESYRYVLECSMIPWVRLFGHADKTKVLGTSLHTRSFVTCESDGDRLARLSPFHGIGKHGTYCTVPRFLKIKVADYRFRPNVLAKNVDSEVCTTSCRKWCNHHCCLSINPTNAP